ncbi:MAG: hypothetical protein WCP99_00755 [Burkholderiales bacterium]
MKASKAEKPAKSDKSKKSEKDAKLKKSKKGDKKGVEVKAKVADAPKVPEKKSQPKVAAKPAQAVKASSKPKAGKVASAAGAGALDPRITNREFKLLLNPEGLDRRNKVMQLDSLVVTFARQCGLEFFHLDNANTGLRNVYFFDTPGEDLRHASLILRVRESRQNVWVDDWCEVTFKCRAHDFETAAAFDPTPNVPHRNRMRFKEEILRGDGLGSSRQIFSNNAVLDSVPVDKVFGSDFGSATKFFPNLKQLALAKNVPIGIVGGKVNKILEACLPLGTISFGSGVQAHVELAIWMRSVGEPIIGELAYAYRVTDENRGNMKAHQKADQFFKDLQPAIADWLATGTTKTALVYGKPE